MLDWKETKNDYKTEKEQKDLLTTQNAAQIEQISQLQQKLAEQKQKNEILQQQLRELRAKNAYLIYGIGIQKQQGEEKIKDLKRQLEIANLEQTQLEQIDTKLSLQQEQIINMEIKVEQSQVEQEKLKVQIEFDVSYPELEIEEQLQSDKKSVVLKGYANKDSSLYTLKKVIELQRVVQKRESISFNGLLMNIIYQ